MRGIEFIVVANTFFNKYTSLSKGNNCRSLSELFEEQKKVETKSCVYDEQCEFLTSPFCKHEWLLSSNNFDSIHLGNVQYLKANFLPFQKTTFKIFFKADIPLILIVFPLNPSCKDLFV